MDVPAWWIERAKDGDEWCLERIFALTEPFVREFVSTHLVDPHDVDDVVQEVLIAIWKYLDTYDSKKGTFENWVSSIIWQHINRYRWGGWTCPDPRSPQLETVSWDGMEDATW